MHPTLFPILLVLTRLEPSPNGRGNSNPTLYDLNTFIPYLRKCAKHPQHKARVMSATALGAILSSEYVVETLSTVIEEAKQSMVQKQHNSLHGSLLIVMAVCENLFHVGSRMPTENCKHMGIDFDNVKNQVYAFCKIMINNVLSKNIEVVCFPLCSVLLKIINFFRQWNMLTRQQIQIKCYFIIYSGLGIQFAHDIMTGVKQQILHRSTSAVPTLWNCARNLSHHLTRFNQY